MLMTWPKFRALYGVFAQDWFAYKANGVIWVISDLVTALTMPFVWTSAASAGLIQGYSAPAFVTYYLAMLILGSFITSHMMWEINFEIRDGLFTTYLLRPVDFFQYSMVRNFTWRTIRTLFTLPFLLALIAMYGYWVGQSKVFIGWEFWVSTLLGHGVSICFVLMLAMTSLWIQEAQTVFELYYLPQLFLSGYMFPLAMLPDWAQQISRFLPFYYTTGVPVELFVGALKPQDAHILIGVQVFWIVFTSAMARFLWRRGLKHYTGVGT